MLSHIPIWGTYLARDDPASTHWGISKYMSLGLEQRSFFWSYSLFHHIEDGCLQGHKTTHGHPERCELGMPVRSGPNMSDKGKEYKNYLNPGKMVKNKK